MTERVKYNVINSNNYFHFKKHALNFSLRNNPITNEKERNNLLTIQMLKLIKLKNHKNWHHCDQQEYSEKLNLISMPGFDQSNITAFLGIQRHDQCESW